MVTGQKTTKQYFTGQNTREKTLQGQNTTLQFACMIAINHFESNHVVFFTKLPLIPARLTTNETINILCNTELSSDLLHFTRKIRKFRKVCEEK